MAVIALARGGSPPGPAPDHPAVNEPRPRLRVALLAATRQQPRALAEAFAAISRSSFAQIVLVATGNHGAATLPWPWRAYRRLDRWVFAAKSAESVAEPVDLIAQLGAVQTLEIPPPDADLPTVNRWRAEIVALRPDVAFVLGDFECKAIESAAKYGLWRLGGEQSGATGLEGFREVVDGQAITVVRLCATQADAGEKLLYESRTRTSPFSVGRNRDQLLRRMARMPGRVLKDLQRSGDLAPLRPLPPAAQAKTAELEITRSLAKIGERIVWRALQKLLFAEQWFIAYRFGNGAGETPMLGKFTCLTPPKDRFWADPFPLERDGRHFIFFEELVFAEGKAHIAVVEVDRDGNCSQPQHVLERPYHLSYPFLIETEGQLFMVPESGQNGSVELYRCLHFPERWVLEKVLLRAPCCADATFHYADDRWWMFVNIGTDDSDVHDELHLYHAENLCGEWQAHPMNPIKSDVRSARPAGRPYVRDGQLYRPAQIGAPLYGSGISINRVLKLTPEEYREQEVERLVPPGPGPILGIHTLNGAGSLSVVDGFARRKRWRREALGSFEPARLGPDLDPHAQGESTTEAPTATEIGHDPAAATR